MTLVAVKITHEDTGEEFGEVQATALATYLERGYEVVDQKAAELALAADGVDLSLAEIQDEVTPPSKAASKADWVEFVTRHRGVSPEAAETATRDELAETYGG